MTVCSMTRSKVKVTSPWKLEILSFLKAISSAIYSGSWQLTTDSEIRAHYLNLFGPDFLIFVPVFVSRDFEVGRNVSYEESTVSPIRITTRCYANVVCAVVLCPCVHLSQASIVPKCSIGSSPSLDSCCHVVFLIHIGHMDQEDRQHESSLPAFCNMNRDEGSYQLSHIWDKLLHTDDRHWKSVLMKASDVKPKRW